MRKPRAINLNPQEFEFSFTSVSNGDGNLPNVLVTVPEGCDWILTEQEARAIGNFFLAHAKYVRAQLKKKPKEDLVGHITY